MRLPQITTLFVTLSLVGFATFAACSGDNEPPEQNTTDNPADNQAEKPDTKPKYNLNIPEVTYTLNPQAGDKSVSAELGGPGFTGEGWETNLTFPARGSAEAVKGGEMVRWLPDWPATLRMVGQNANTSFNYYAVGALTYQSLLDIHPTTLESIPALATHWQISEDKKTYRFRINPEARWSDGKEVTSADVIATWKLLVDPGILAPSTNVSYSRFEEPRSISKYIVEVTVKEESWRNFLSFSGMGVFPAHELEGLSGKEYLDKYQFAYLASSGPYHVKSEDINTGNTITVSRREDFWAKDNPAYTGMYNIDRFKHVVVKEPGLAFEKLKKGELDYMVVMKAQWWAEDMPGLSQVQRGLLVMKKFYNFAPIGTSGIAINQSRPPLDDVRIRKALQHLYDRKTMIEKLYYNEYEPLTSYWQGPTYANPTNELFEYDELTAVELLEEAGWTEKNADGYRVKDGQELKFTISYRSALSERNLTVFQEAAKRAGIRLELQLLTPAAGWKNLTAKEYDLASTAWGALLFPNPESAWKGDLADQPNNNNVTAFKNAEVDALITKYQNEYDSARRAEIIQQIDKIIYNEHPYILGWYNPARRVAYWNKFKTPEWGGMATVREDELTYTFWIDPELDKQLTAARAGESLKMDPGERKNRFWETWAAAQKEQKPMVQAVKPEDGQQ